MNAMLFLCLEYEMDIQGLPEGCISHVIALTGPRDACRSAAVSPTFRAAAASDGVWERFLPEDYEFILARAVGPIEYASKRELYFRLCDQPLLVDGGKMSFALDKSSGAKCYTLPARALTIVWGDCPQYWRWIPLPRSRQLIFKEAAELLNVCWLEVHGKIDSKVLTRNTTYAAYLIFKLADSTNGLHYPAQEASVSIGNHVSSHKVCLHRLCDGSPPPRGMCRFRQHWYLPVVTARRRGAVRQEAETAAAVEGKEPEARSDGWMEMELGEFHNDEGDDGEIDMSLMEVKGGQWKNGLIIYGIEIRPKKVI